MSPDQNKNNTQQRNPEITEKPSLSFSNKFIETFSLTKAQTTKHQILVGGVQNNRDLDNVIPSAMLGVLVVDG